jgi:hypothetical protein
MIHTRILAAGILLFAASAATAQPPFPRQYPQPFPQQPFPQHGPGPVAHGSIVGHWYFRGDPFAPCFIEPVRTPRGEGLLFTNENGTTALGWLSRNGRSVTIPEWNLKGTLRGNSLVWPNGDFWSR